MAAGFWMATKTKKVIRWMTVLNIQRDIVPETFTQLPESMPRSRSYSRSLR